MSLLEGLLFKKKSCLIQWRKNIPGFVINEKIPGVLSMSRIIMNYYNAKV